MATAELTQPEARVLVAPDVAAPAISSAPSRTATLGMMFIAATMFLSAFLLFSVEPIVAKMVLPLLGGTPAVWNTCLVFFQAVLLAGYLYAHLSTKLLRPRQQVILHLCVLLLAFVVLPVHIPLGWVPPVEQNPAPWLLALLAISVGLPFFVLSAGTPILQKWFSHSSHHEGSDPYFLYVASNAGSLFGLLSYPLVLEPALRLAMQSRAWSCLYILFFLMACGCGAITWHASHIGMCSIAVSLERSPNDASENIRTKRRLRWVVLAFVPASLTLGITTALTTDIPAIPLFWVLPLAIYLLSFIFVFARKPLISHAWLIRRLPFLILGALFPVVSRSTLPILIWIPLDLLTLFGVAMVCHGELARIRPSTRHLTEFYLWISVGGVLGGIFNALVAPLIFRSVIEFPLVLALAALLRPPIDVKESTPRARRLDVLLPVTLGLTLFAVIWILQSLGLRPGRAMNILIFGFSLEWCLSFGKRPVRFALGLVAILLASTLYTGPYGHILHTERSFFGVNRVTDDDHKQFRMLFHGGTVHGMQNLDPAKAREPLSYYTRLGPIGQVFAAFPARGGDDAFAFVGLGAGSMACYLSPSQQLTYYEIDPAVERIAGDTRYFTFLRDCGPQARIVLGDARLSLRAAPDQRYRMIVVDAFSGDSIPVHLLTRQALQLYLTKLAPGGILVFHITNIHLNLQPVLATLAADAGLSCLVEDDTAVSEADIAKGRFPSTWVVMARHPNDLGRLASDARWKPLLDRRGSKIWTDDYSSVISIVKWQ